MAIGIYIHSKMSNITEENYNNDDYMTERAEALDNAVMVSDYYISVEQWIISGGSFN